MTSWNTLRTTTISFMFGRYLLWIELARPALILTMPAKLETQVWFLGQEDPLETGLATHSCILDWRIPWGREELDWTEQLTLSLFTFNCLLSGVSTFNISFFWYLTHSNILVLLPKILAMSFLVSEAYLLFFLEEWGSSFMLCSFRIFVTWSQHVFNYL